jgi:hypothetical protein
MIENEHFCQLIPLLVDHLQMFLAGESAGHVDTLSRRDGTSRATAMIFGVFRLERVVDLREAPVKGATRSVFAAGTWITAMKGRGCPATVCMALRMNSQF